MAVKTPIQAWLWNLTSGGVGVLCSDYLDPADHDGGQWSSISYLSSDIQRNILQIQSAYRAEALVAIITIIPHNTPRAAATISSHPASDPSQGSQLK